MQPDALGFGLFPGRLVDEGGRGPAREGQAAGRRHSAARLVTFFHAELQRAAVPLTPTRNVPPAAAAPGAVREREREAFRLLPCVRPRSA